MLLFIYAALGIKETSTFTSLPQELKVHSAVSSVCHFLFSQFAIMRNLNVHSLLSLSATCKQMHHLAFDILWLSLLKKDLWNGGECYDACYTCESVLS